MSTYVYLVCDSHEPPLVAGDESGQHLYNLPAVVTAIAHAKDVADLFVANGSGQAVEALVIAKAGPVRWDAHYGRHTGSFLAQHTTCRLGIVDEYGRRYDPATGEEMQEAPTSDETPCPCVSPDVVEWTATCWWRAVAPDGSLWAESSDEAEVRERARPDDTIQRLYETVPQPEWRDA